MQLTPYEQERLYQAGDELKKMARNVAIFKKEIVKLEVAFEDVSRVTIEDELMNSKYPKNCAVVKCGDVGSKIDGDRKYWCPTHWDIKVKKNKNAKSKHTSRMHT